MDFLWDSGGNWNNSSWSADLPTDSALLLYLFAAYVAAPQWLFHDDNDSKIEGPEGTLYLGKIPSRIAGHYLAITSTRVSSGAKVSAASINAVSLDRQVTILFLAGHSLQVSGIVGLHLTSQQPYFSLYRSGEVILTESGQNGLFTILILFIKMFLRNGYNFHLLHLHEILELTANF